MATLSYLVLHVENRSLAQKEKTLHSVRGVATAGARRQVVRAVSNAERPGSITISSLNFRLFRSPDELAGRMVAASLGALHNAEPGLVVAAVSVVVLHALHVGGQPVVELAAGHVSL